MNLAQARHNMIEQQIRPWEVLDQRVLDAMARLPRDAFVGADYQRLAYADIMVPIGDGQVMMQPRVEARLLQALRLGDQDRVLEIGTGSGWLTALLATLAGHVYSIDTSASLLSLARENLAAHNIVNVTLEQRDGAEGWEVHAPYDAIAVTGSLPRLADALLQQLTIGGRLFAVVGEAPAMEALLVRRVGDREWSRESLFETVLPALSGVAMPDRFVL